MLAHKSFRWWILKILLAEICRTNVTGLPSLHGTPVEPVIVRLGEEAILVCEAKNTVNYTVIWQRLPALTTEILTAGTVRVTSDKRFSVIHEDGSDIWALRIFPVKIEDGGRYICQVNSVPSLNVVRILNVEASNETSHYISLQSDSTGCCMEANIPLSCLQFCSLHSVLSRSHPSPWQCMDYLPRITRCLTDGRDHLPCCTRQNIPEMCRSVCVGDYQLSTVIQHYSCMNYTVPTLACIAEGLEILPGPPRGLIVEPISSREMIVSWLGPSQNVPVSQYLINITKLHKLASGEQLEVVDRRKGKGINYQQNLNTSRLEIVTSNETEHTLSNLDPETVYEIKVSSSNEQGHSLPTYAVRTMTLPEKGSLNVYQHSLPVEEDILALNLTVPDIKECCQNRGVKMERCLENMCDLTKSDQIKLTDVMICAPWANVTFECMAGDFDHSSCCKQRQVPTVCLDFCRGKVTRVDYRHFVCLEFMEAYGNCLLEHYQVLPSPPQQYSVRLIHSEWALFHWKAPKVLSESVVSYNIHWREIENQDGEYQAIYGVKSPYLLDGLTPGVQYESYVVATNQFGTSQHSTQVVFTSSPLVKSTEIESQAHFYNETACCISAGLNDECLPLCNYDVKLSEMFSLGPKCVHHLDVLLRCAAAGRDHTTCCQHRAVSWDCLPMCSGTLSISQYNLGAVCTADLGNVLQCMKDGVDLLPGIPQNFHALIVNVSNVELHWDSAPEGAESNHFEIRYNQIEHGIPPHPLNYQMMLNSSSNSSAIIKELEIGKMYSIYVVAANSHGFSQPSPVIIISIEDNNKSTFNNSTTKIYGTLGAPHSLEVIDETATTIALRWIPPNHLAPDSSIKYSVYYLPVSQTGTLEESGLKQDTMFTSAEIANLTASTQYAIAVRASSTTGQDESILSEVILAWTEAPTPAFVNPPLIIPAGPIIEGRNITIMCIAMGTPSPTVSLYVNAEVVAEKVQHHVTHTIANIHHNITNTACFADNGHGQGAYSALEIKISFPPLAEALKPDVSAVKGRMAKLQCQVQGFPEPRVFWYKGVNKEQLIQRGPQIEMEITTTSKAKSTFTANLILTEYSDSQSGDYLCSAENPLGSSVTSFKVHLQSENSRNTSVCCREQKVSPSCMDACAFDVDIQLALDKPECLRDLNKLMFCAADGRDHRKCCRDKGIPRKCRRWCMGNSVLNAPLCALVAAKDIVTCFQEGKAVLPGPPKNVQIEQKEKLIQVHWEPPETNPNSVEWYRVFWRPVGTRALFKNETNSAFMTLEGLEEGKTYEVAIKSGNHYGLSIHTDPIVIHINGQPGTRPTALIGEASVAVKVVIGVVVIILLAVLAVVVVILYLKRKRLEKEEAGGGVSFENPAYLKDTSSNGPPQVAQATGDENCIQLSSTKPTVT